MVTIAILAYRQQPYATFNIGPDSYSYTWKVMSQQAGMPFEPYPE